MFKLLSKRPSDVNSETSNEGKTVNDVSSKTSRDDGKTVNDETTRDEGKTVSDVSGETAMKERQ